MFQLRENFQNLNNEFEKELYQELYVSLNSYSKIGYEPKTKLEFTNGKCLIYKNNRTILTSIQQSSIYWGSIGTFAYLIFTNPFADIFPAAIPILVISELLLIKLWIHNTKKNASIVKEIYLLENGEATEIWFANEQKRSLFGEETKKLYYNSIFVDPDYEKEEIILSNKDNRMFPLTLEQSKQQKTGYAWVKYFSNGENMIIIPKKSEFMNLEVLIEVFKGKIIKNKI